MRVKTKAGAACRMEAALDSPIVAQLDKGTVVRALDEMDVAGLRRVRIVAPCAGWVTSKCLAPAPEASAPLAAAPDARAAAAPAAAAPARRPAAPVRTACRVL